MASPSLLRSSQCPDRRFISSLGSASAGKKPIAARHSVATSPRASFDGDDTDADRVRVAVRVRPKSDEDFSDSEFSDCLELQPELRRLKLRKNSWSSESYKFDEVFTEAASQKRVYEAIAKPVVEGVLNGYNGTIMAYGQTGTGKTYTIGRLGKDNLSERGIMVRALEDILVDTSTEVDKVSISYLQLYLESMQDLLAPDKANIAIIEDAKSGEVCILNATVVEIREIEQFLQVLQIGEANRHSANTKMNARSSRSHAILVVYVHRFSKGKDENEFLPLEATDDNDSKSKLLIIDLAGSERIDKSGVDGHVLEEAKFINLSLTSLGKCINALAENSPHIPTRDSKLTRVICDSFGGTARASLIVTVGPSVRHYSETSSTIMFGQRAMKVVNMFKVKQDYDYESQCRKLDGLIDNLTSELERLEKAKEQLERILYERDIALNEAELKLVDVEQKLAEVENMPVALSEYQIEDSTCHEAFAASEKVYLARTLEEERCHYANIEKQLIEVLEHGSRKFSEAARKINLLAELANHHQAVDANPRAELRAIWFGLFFFALFSLKVLY